jgi:hypothetical protein
LSAAILQPLGWTSLSLQTGGGVNQTAGALTVNTLNVTSVAGIVLPNTVVANFSANNTGAGNIAITNTGNLNLGAVSNPGGNIAVTSTIDISANGLVTAGGNVNVNAGAQIVQNAGGNVTAGGNINLTAGTNILLGLVDAGGAVDLFANGGSIIDNNDVVPDTLNVRAFANSTMFATGTIGVPNCIEINITGTMNVTVQGGVGGVSANLCGVVAPINMINLPVPAPGQVFWNGVWVNAPPAAPGLGNLAGNGEGLNALTLILGSEENRYGWIFSRVAAPSVVYPHAGVLNEGSR